MTKGLQVDKELKLKADTFIDKIDSNMKFKSEIASDAITFSWIDEIEFACQYVDNIVRNPKVTLINESDVVKIEKARKISVESVKDLAKNTHYIDKIDEKTNEISPSKILVLFREETFNIYENRFVYTLIDNLSKFVYRKEQELENIDIKNDKVLEYAASTNNGQEKVKIELKISSKEMPKDNSEGFDKQVNAARARIKKINDYIGTWKRSELVTSLDKAHVSFVTSPIRKTNMILKNPNFQIAMKLWEFLQTYDVNENDSSINGLETEGNQTLKEILNDSFLMDYYVLDSISKSKREQKSKIINYAIMMINQQLQRAISLLLSNGIDITDEELLNLISQEIKKEQDRVKLGSSDVKRKFKNSIEEYLEKTKNNL